MFLSHYQRRRFCATLKWEVLSCLRNGSWQPFLGKTLERLTCSWKTFHNLDEFWQSYHAFACILIKLLWWYTIMANLPKSKTLVNNNRGRGSASAKECIAWTLEQPFYVVLTTFKMCVIIVWLSIFVKSGLVHSNAAYNDSIVTTDSGCQFTNSFNYLLFQVESQNYGSEQHYKTSTRPASRSKQPCEKPTKKLPTKCSNFRSVFFPYIGQTEGNIWLANYINGTWQTTK